MFCGIWRPTYSTLADGRIRHGDGSGPTTGHQNRSAANRYRPCSSRCAQSFSSATLNSGEKWLAHMTPANRSHDTTGNDRNRTGREWSTGRIQRRRVAGDETRRSRTIGPAYSSRGGATRTSSRCWTMWTENSVVS